MTIHAYFLVNTFFKHKNRQHIKHLQHLCHSPGTSSLIRTVHDNLIIIQIFRRTVINKKGELVVFGPYGRSVWLRSLQFSRLRVRIVISGICQSVAFLRACTFTHNIYVFGVSGTIRAN